MNKKYKLIGLLLACVFMVSVFPAAGFCEYDQVARLGELIAKSTEKKQKVDNVLGGMKSQVQSLTSARQGVVDAYKLLVRKRQKLNAIQSWNAFVGFVNVGFTALQKINPGNSVAVATATFLQDRASEALPNPPFQAKMERLSKSFNSMGPALRQLDKVCSLSDQEVADLLVSRGFVKNSWLTRWKTTPEAVKNSAAVITGRTTLILERIGPALGALFNIKKEMDSGIAMALAYVDQLEQESARLGADIKSYERQIGLVKAYEKAGAPKPLPKPVETFYPGPCPPEAYGPALSGVKDAWSSLKSNAIDGDSYRAIKREKSSSAWAYYNQVLKPFGDAYQKAWKSYMHTLRVVLPSIPDSKTRMRVYRAAGARLNAVVAQYYTAQTREYKKIQSQFLKPLKEVYKKEKQEQEACAAFIRKYNSWLDQRIEYTANDWKHRTSALTTETSTIRQLYAYRGSSLYLLAWWPSSRLSRIASAMQGLPWAPFPGAGKVYVKWLEEIKKLEDKAREIKQYCNSSDQRFHGLAQELDAFGKELSQNIEVWMYVSGWEVSRGLSATLSTALMLYEANREVGQANMTAYMTRIQEAAGKASEITRAMAAEPEITKKAGQAILARIDAFNAFRHGNVVHRGAIVRDILEGNGITRENLDKIRELLPTLNNPEVLEKHALTLLPGEAGYDYKFARLVDPGFFKTIEKICMMQLNSASAGRSAYESAFSSYASDQSALESALAQLEKKLASVAPAMLGFVSAENVTRDWIRKNKPSFPPGLSSNWVPPDPAYFYDPIPSDTAYLKKVGELLAKYQKIVLPVFERMKKGGYKEVRLLDEMAAELEKITPGWINLEPGDFSTRYNKYSSTAYNLYRTVQGKGWGGPGTPVTKAYLKVMRILNSISTRHADKQTRIRIIKGLELTVRSITGFLKEPDRMGGPASAKSWQEEILRKAGPESEARGFKADPRIAGLINSLLGLEKKLGNYIENAEKQKVAQGMALIHELYKKFAAFYSNKDINSLLSLISPAWSASDGSGIDDIEELLDNSFSVFDNIKYELKDLKIKPAGNGDFQVTYTSRITGQILDQDLEHNETSQVSDIVRIKDGRAIIMKTMGGCFWQ